MRRILVSSESDPAFRRGPLERSGAHANVVLWWAQVPCEFEKDETRHRKTEKQDDGGIGLWNVL